MLNSLRFTNFKSWEKAELHCGRITGVFGTNSSGKTSLLQFLLLLKQTKDTSDRAIALELNGEFVELGTIRDAIHKHDEERAIEFGLSLQLQGEHALVDPSAQRTSAITRGDLLDFGAFVRVYRRAPVTDWIAYTL